MRKHIVDMMAGEHIILVVHTQFEVKQCLRGTELPPHIKVNLSQQRWDDPQSGGWVIFMSAQTEWYRLQGLLADIRFVRGSASRASREFYQLAQERSSRYAAQRKCKPSNK